jgi:protein SMG5
MQKPMSVQLTPYIVLDTKCLSDYTSIVKNLVKTKAFVILIPKAGKLPPQDVILIKTNDELNCLSVLSELDDLKKSSEGVRTAIKWLEMEFKKGNRFLRSQRNNETLVLPLIKIKKKMGELLLSNGAQVPYT